VFVRCWTDQFLLAGSKLTIGQASNVNPSEDTALLLRDWVYVKLMQNLDAGTGVAAGNTDTPAPGQETMTVPPQTSAPMIGENATSTWWDYVPVLGASKIASIQPDSDAKPVNATVESPPAPEEPEIEVDTRMDDSVRTVKPIPKPKAASVFSGETIQSSQSWLAPWTWYPGALAPQLPNSGDDEGKGDQGGPVPGEEREEDGKTKAEVVKEEALARPEPKRFASDEVGWYYAG
jgi:hypothetical protein